MLKNRTKVQDTVQLIDELNNDGTWAWNKIYPTNPNLELTFATVGTFSVETQTLNLATVVDADIYGVKTFWIKGSNDTDYVPAHFYDSNDAVFLSRDQLDAQVLQPTAYTIYNFTTIRIAPAVPALTEWRTDWIGKPPNFSLNSECVTSIPSPLHEAMLSRTEGVLWRGVDDTRSKDALNEAEALLIQGIRNVKRRQFKDRPKIKPFTA